EYSARQLQEGLQAQVTDTITIERASKHYLDAVHLQIAPLPLCSPSPLARGALDSWRSTAVRLAENLHGQASFATASAKSEGARCAYRNVITIDACPRSSRTVLSGTPRCTRRLAKWCLVSWNLKF